MSFAPSASVVIAEFARFCVNSAIATFALVAKLCKFYICNIFAPGKFGANLIFRPVNTRENWKNSKLCENTPPCGHRVSTQFLVFPISTRVDI